MTKLLAVTLGGRAPGASIELHDVVFTAGERIEDTYEDLLARWFGTPTEMHVDSWLELTVVDGHRVELRPESPPDGPRLYFVNLGAYRPGQFGELHAVAFLVAADPRTAKRRAKEKLLVGLESVHTDDLYDVDDCLEIGQVAGLHVWLEPTDEPEDLTPHNGYHVIPEESVRGFLASGGDPALGVEPD